MNSIMVMNSKGVLMNPYCLKDSDFDIDVIAQTLSRTCRFWGQTKKFYSVAQHCLVMSEILSGNQELQKWALLHEAFEGLTGMDVPAPIKNSPYMQEYRLAEQRALKQAARLFGLTPTMPDEVVIADRRLLVSEALVLMDTQNYDWEQIAKPYSKDILEVIHQESILEVKDFHETIKCRFLKKWHELF